MKIKWYFYALFGLLVALHSSAQAAPTQLSIKRIMFSPVACSRNDCWAHGQNAEEHARPKASEIQHGNIQLIYLDNRKVQVTHGATAVNNRSTEDEATANAQLSPDGKTVGWTQGHHQKCTDWSAGGTMFVNSQLVLFRDGKVLHVLEVPGTFIENWRFWNNGKYVAIGSRWHHGMGYVRLFDVNSGRLLERLSTHEAKKKKLKWAENSTP